VNLVDPSGLSPLIIVGTQAIYQAKEIVVGTVEPPNDLAVVNIDTGQFIRELQFLGWMMGRLPVSDVPLPSLPLGGGGSSVPAKPRSWREKVGAIEAKCLKEVFGPDVDPGRVTMVYQASGMKHPVWGEAWARAFAGMIRTADTKRGFWYTSGDLIVHEFYHVFVHWKDPKFVEEYNKENARVFEEWQNGNHGATNKYEDEADQYGELHGQDFEDCLRRNGYYSQ
jgi:hypothetical protein